MPANFLSYTAPINPPSTTPTLTLSQIWTALRLKIRSGETFVPNAIKSTSVVREYTSTPLSLPTIDREVTFHEGNRVMKETCVEYYPLKVEFLQTDGGRVMNIVSQGSGEQGVDLFMTYSFEWVLPEGVSAEEQEEKRKGQEKMAKVAVESTIEIMRGMAREGKL
ncbi:uncharacterized protein AB675_702 [Cyphellophora attinorum]|uniref:DUF1857-domain-containing protein n=1 Tax=Cyphellophora attinorum TaxID=1664694 RepID=A0A0N1P3K4_9EURO|nr:uncharacterized protein AB675_702 [Phialophora attinorum]KPI45573.1 hypothetical protein AB675_702 [Phialophora attinorum]